MAFQIIYTYIDYEIRFDVSVIYGEGNLCSIFSNAVLNIDELNFKQEPQGALIAHLSTMSTSVKS